MLKCTLNKGGQLGLFIGVSLLSFFEAVELLIEFLNALLKKKQNSKKQNMVNTVQTVQMPNRGLSGKLVDVSRTYIDI